MWGVQVQIVRWVDNHQPGFVECELTDVHGHCWSFIEKLPMVTAEDLDESSRYPRPGVIGCEVIEKANENDVVLIDTSSPWYLEAVGGATRFEVSAAALIEFDWPASL